MKQSSRKLSCLAHPRSRYQHRFTTTWGWLTLRRMKWTTLSSSSPMLSSLGAAVVDRLSTTIIGDWRTFTKGSKIRLWTISMMQCVWIPRATQPSISIEVMSYWPSKASKKPSATTKRHQKYRHQIRSITTLRESLTKHWLRRWWRITETSTGGLILRSCPSKIDALMIWSATWGRTTCSIVRVRSKCIRRP